NWKAEDEIQFLASKGTSSVIGKINPMNDRKEILFQGDDHSIMDISFGNQDQIYFTSSRPIHPFELYEWDTGTGAKRLTHHNAWLEDITLGKQEIIRYQSRDGKYEIEGILIHPTNSSARPAPT